VNNLDILVLLIKNWLDDLTICVEHKGGPKKVHGFGEDEDILDVMDAKFSNELEDHVEDCVQN
jgi:hypothetical protein